MASSSGSDRGVMAESAFATVGWFDRGAQQYRRIPVDEQCEVLSLIGDVAEGQDGPVLHAHVVLGLSDGTTRGGHLLEGLVFRTLEVVVTEPRRSCARSCAQLSGSHSSIWTGPRRDPVVRFSWNASS